MMPRVWAITAPVLSDDELARRVTAACAVGKDALCIHLRDKLRDAARLRPLAVRLREATRAGGSWLAVGDHPALAGEVGADVAHGWAGRAGRAPWSVPVHTDDDVRRALDVGADVALVSPVFASPGKGSARGLDAIVSARALAPRLALYALGGVDASNARACLDAGADGVAVVRAVFLAANPARAVSELLRILR